jgi:hypothetical protein
MLGRRDRGDIVNAPESLIILFFLSVSLDILNSFISTSFEMRFRIARINNMFTT